MEKSVHRYQCQGNGKSGNGACVSVGRPLHQYSGKPAEGYDYTIYDMNYRELDGGV